MSKSITTEENMQAFLDAALEVAGIDAAFALALPGHSPKTFWRWMKDDTLFVRWPRGSEKIPFRDAYAAARRMWRVTFDAKLREVITVGDLYVATSPSGQIIYQEDAELLAEFGENTPENREKADSLGIFDFPYVHERDPKTGKLRRMPLMVRRPAPATLRIHGARAMLGESGWNPSEKKEIDSRTQAQVLVVGATQPALKPYHKDYKLSEQQQQLEKPKTKSIEDRIKEIHQRNPNSALVKDLTARLSVAPQNPTPRGAHGERLDPRVAVQRGGSNDPQELTGAKVAAEGKPRAAPALAAAAPALAAAPQPEPDLAEADKVSGRPQQFADTETAWSARRGGKAVFNAVDLREHDMAASPGYKIQ